MSLRIIILLFPAFFLIKTARLFGQPGTLDSSFGVNGFVAITTGAASPMEMQPDGKLVFGGDRIVRYLNNGSLDNSFGTNGFLSLSYSASPVTVTVIKILSDKRFVILGYAYPGPTFQKLLLVSRLLPSGIPDNTFNGNGTKVLPFLTDSLNFYDMEVSSDGKIVLAGDEFYLFAVARLTANGKVDSSFGTNGIVHTSFAEGSGARSVALQDNGKIVVVGTTETSYLGYGADSLAVARYNTDGSLDSSFRGKGKFTYAPSSYRNSGQSGAEGSRVVIQPDGKIVIGGILGYTQSHGRWVNMDCVLWRLNPDGSMDSTFNGDGEKPIQGEYITNEFCNLQLQCDGKIVVSRNTGADDFISQVYIALSRVTADGALDNSFGSNGNQVLYLDQANKSYSMALYHDRIYVAGFTLSPPDEYLFAFKNGDCNEDPPVNIYSLTARLINSQVLLNWTSANAGGFTIQRSNDGKKFIPVSSQKSLTTPGKHQYRYLDLISNNVSSLLYYRVQQTDSLGNKRYSEVIPVSRKEEVLTMLYPNPVKQKVRVSVNLREPRVLRVGIFNSIGQLVATSVKKIEAGNAMFEIDVTTLPAGLYFLKTDNEAATSTRKFIKE